MRIYANHRTYKGGLDQFIEEVDNRIAELKGGNGIDSSSDVEASSGTKYVLEDTYGAPQAGVDTIEFDSIYDVQDYLDENPDVQDRINEGYAGVYERPAVDGCDAIDGCADETIDGCADDDITFV